MQWGTQSDNWGKTLLAQSTPASHGSPFAGLLPEACPQEDSAKRGAYWKWVDTNSWGDWKTVVEGATDIYRYELQLTDTLILENTIQKDDSEKKRKHFLIWTDIFFSTLDIPLSNIEAYFCDSPRFIRARKASSFIEKQVNLGLKCSRLIPKVFRITWANCY